MSRILIHDYAGHAFPISLSRSLAERGYTVCHAFASSQQTPRGALKRRDDDPENLTFHAIGMNPDYVKDKYSFPKRRKHECNYGKTAAEFIKSWNPDVVLSGNTPTETQGYILKAANIASAPFVYWVQDFYSIAVTQLLRKKLPIIGEPIGWYYRKLDKSHLIGSAAVICITEDFKPYLQKWSVQKERSHVIPNWAELNAFPLKSKYNPWARKHSLEDKFVFLYSGTLGMKHNPELLSSLAEHFLNDSSVQIVVNSEGIGAEFLKDAKIKRNLKNLTINSYQPFEEIADVLASADVLLTILEPEAGVFSVPSKTLSYLCAGRPILGAMPTENLAAKIVTEESAGRIVEPSDIDGFLQTAHGFYSDQSNLQDMGTNARAYAESTFSIHAITARFEEIFKKVTSVK